MISTSRLTQSRRLLDGARRPLLATHVAPDGDAVGSLLGLGRLLRSPDRQPVLACQDRLPRRFDYLADFDQVVNAHPGGRFDLLIALDCSDPERIGNVGCWDGLADVPVLNIDHHVTNLDFGTVNLVDVEAVSTTHVLHHLARHMGLEIDAPVADALLTGLVTDTRGFRTTNVTADVLRIAVDLIETGASLVLATHNGLDRRSLGTLRLWGHGLTRVEEEDGLVWTSLPLEAHRESNGQGASGLANVLSGAENARMVAVFTERDDGQIEVGLRAAPGYDVSEIALALGGGGHRLASGCLVPGPLEDAQQRVLGLLREDLARQRRLANNDRRYPQS